MLTDSDPDLREMAEEEVTAAESFMATAEADLQILMLPKDPKDKSNVFLEIRAGTGGDEAAIFSGDLFRMYSRYAESKRWAIEVISERAGEHGGYKEIITRVAGESVYAHLKFESGAHRVQEFLKLSLRGGSTRQHALLQSWLNLMRSKKLKSVKKIYGSTLTARPALVASTSTRPTLPFA